MLVLLRLWFFLRKTTPASPELRYNGLFYGRLDYFQVYSLLYLILPEGQVPFSPFLELILVTLKMASGYPPSHLPSQGVNSKSELHDVHMVMCMSKGCCFYLNTNCVYTSLYMHAPTFPSTYKNTCHFIRTLHITISEEKEDTVPSKGQRTLKNINLLQFVKTARNFQL